MRTRANVAPVSIETDHHRISGFLHNGVVHGLIRALAENIMWDIDEIAAIIGGIHRSLAGFQISGRYLASSMRYFLARNINMPLFQ